MFFLSPQHIFLFCFVLKTELLSSIFVFYIALFCGFVLKGINQWLYTVPFWKKNLKHAVQQNMNISFKQFNVVCLCFEIQ